MMRELLCMGRTDSDREEKNKETRKREEDSEIWKDRELSISFLPIIYLHHSSENCTHINMQAYSILTHIPGQA